MAIDGTAGNDNLPGTAAADLFRLRQGGDDIASGLAGNDSFYFRAAFSALDAIDGGADNDRVVLNGDYSSGILFGATTMTNVETLRLGGAFDYSLTTHDATVAAGARLTVNAGQTGAAHALTFDGSAELDGHFTIFAGAGNDMLTGGAKGDRFNLAMGGNDTAYGGGGTDTFVLGASFTAADTIDGGAGYDTLLATGTAAFLNATATTLTGIEEIRAAGTGTFLIHLLDANVAAGARLRIDASAISGSLSANGGAESDGAFDMIGSANSDTLQGGDNNDTFDISGGGFEYVNGWGGDDVIYAGASLDPDDEIYGGFSLSSNDTIELAGDYSALTTFHNVGGVLHGFTYIETLKLDDAGSYNLRIQNEAGESGKTLTVDASALTAGHTASVDVSTMALSHLSFLGGTGSDTFWGGALTDSFKGGGGSDTLTGGDAADTYIYAAASDSSGTTGIDWIRDFNADEDKFSTGTVVTSTSAVSGTVSGALFNQHMHDVAGPELATHEAVLVNVIGGLTGSRFIVVDSNGSHDYEGGSDLVIEITGYSGTVDVSDFI